MKRRTFLKLSSLSAAAFAACPNYTVDVAHAASEGGWSYTGKTGPGHWAGLSDDFALCGSGYEQSPIDLKGRISAVLSDLAIEWKTTPLAVVNNGHTIQINTAPGSRLHLRGKVYELKQFHFHHLSEHTVNGNAYSMEVHFVHASTDGELAVIGVFLEPGAKRGPAWEVINAIWGVMPSQKGERASNIGIALTDLLPTDRSFYRYAGSLTTPPCSEIVTWTVYAKPVQVGQKQIESFAALFPNNARPIQAQHRRFLIGNF